MSKCRRLLRRTIGGMSSATNEKEAIMSTNTVELHRVLKSSADRVYRAFTTAAAFAKLGWTAKVDTKTATLGWASPTTLRLSVPNHERLGHGFDRTAHVALVRTNWFRPLAWTARGALVLWMLVAA